MTWKKEGHIVRRMLDADITGRRRGERQNLKPATGRTLRPCVSAYTHQLKDASTHRSTFCGLRGAFEQSPCFRSTGNVWTPAYSRPCYRRQNAGVEHERATYVIFERKHCSRRRRHTQVELSSSLKCADKTQTIARKRWHGARKRKRWNLISTCGRL